MSSFFYGFVEFRETFEIRELLGFNLYLVLFFLSYDDTPLLPKGRKCKVFHLIPNHENTSCTYFINKLTYSFSSADPSTPFLYRSSAVRQLSTFQIPST
jgi:hypothetical protein